MEDHTRYVLLANNHRNYWTLDRKTFVLVSAIAIPVIFFLGTYMLIFGVYDRILHPITNTLNIPQLSRDRAIKYNEQSINVTKTDYNFVNPIKNFSEIKSYKLVCYYNFPGQEINLLKPDSIDPFLCTHINMAFGTVVNNTLHLENNQKYYLVKMLGLKMYNPDLKILISVGGAGNDQGFPNTVVNHASRKAFIKSVFNYVKMYGVDGVDLDWEFPNENGVNPKQRMHFTQLLEEFRIFINKQTKHKFLVTVAVAAPLTYVDNSYDVTYLNDFVDFINIMTYDYHFFTTVTPFTGINAPLYQSSIERLILSTLNINYTANYWGYKGMDRNKMVIGLPTYGHSFKLMNAKNRGLYAPASGYGRIGSHGFLDYAQVCAFLTINHISPIFDMETKSPYASKMKEWISFDDEQSLSYKAEYIRENKYAGAMVYSLNADDHKGLCNDLKKSTVRNFPLTHKIKQTLNEKF